jgi:hypothetical protein
MVRTARGFKDVFLGAVEREDSEPSTAAPDDCPGISI